MQHRDTVAHHCPLEQCRYLGVLVREHPITTIAERDARAEPGKRLCELAANGTSADDDEMRRTAREGKDGFVCMVRCFTQARHVRHGCPCTSGDHRPPESQGCVADSHRVCRREGGVAQENVYAQLAKAACAISRRQARTSAPHALHHCGEISVLRDRRAAKALRRRSRLAPRAACANDTLAGHTANRKAIAPHEASLHERDTRSESSGNGSRDKPASTSSHHDEMIARPGRRVRPIIRVHGIAQLIIGCVGGQQCAERAVRGAAHAALDV